MARRKSLRSQLYRAARDLGDVEAVQKGGMAGLARRQARKVAYRRSSSLTGLLLRSLGLQGRRR